MDERKIKRLLLMLVMAIVIIVFFKYLLTRAVTNLGNAALEKKHSAVVQQAPAPPASDIPVIDTSAVSAASAVEDAWAAASSVESTTK